MAEETEKSFPFDADEVNGVYDRVYLADDFARYFRAFISSGVFMKESTNLQVMENGDMTVILKPGKLIIDGYRYDNTDDIIIQLEPADGVLNRIDRISGTWSKEDKDIHYTLQKGAPSYEPVPPECRRSEDTKDYVFADVYIKAGAISILQKDITDQRLNSEVCGLANPFNDIDTASIFVQFTSWLDFTREKGEADVATLVADMEEYLEMLEVSGDNKLKEIVEVLQNFETMSESQFLTWFNQMKDQLSEDAAGNLQNQITELATKTTEKIEKIETPDFDDTGEIEGIESFTDFMSSFIKETSIYQLFANLKAGLKYVLHKDMLVNNCVTDNPDLPLAAEQGKELQDQITQLYSDLGGFEPVIDETTGKITGYKTTAGGADTVFPFSEIDKALLVNALKHSGLGITTESTAEYIYQRLSQAFPYSLYILQGGSIKKSFVWNLSKTNGNAQFTASGGTINTFFDSEAYVTYTATSSKILFDEYAKNIVLNVGNIYYAGNRPNAYHNVTMYVNDINKGTQAITANGTNTWAINDVVKSVYFVVTIYHGYHTINVSLNNIYLQN